MGVQINILLQCVVVAYLVCCQMNFNVLKQFFFFLFWQKKNLKPTRKMIDKTKITQQTFTFHDSCFKAAWGR